MAAAAAIAVNALQASAFSLTLFLISRRRFIVKAEVGWMAWSCQR
jgi:hypothetical protein